MSHSKKTIAIIQTKWNKEITDQLSSDAQSLLELNNIIVNHYFVPGAVELPVAAKNIIDKTNVDAVICIGTVILGDTDHYHYVSNMAATGISRVALDTGVPVIFGVLTCKTREQAIIRTDGTLCCCGKEWAEVAIDMVHLIDSLSSDQRN